jgi:hypothetical protein
MKLVTPALDGLDLSYSTPFDSVFRELRKPRAHRTAASAAPAWFH